MLHALTLEDCRTLHQFFFRREFRNASVGSQSVYADRFRIALMMPEKSVLPPPSSTNA